MKILYFAWLREKVGTSEEDIDLPANISTAEALLDWLADRHEGLRDVLDNSGIIRIAINQDYAESKTKVHNADEVALFPPVTGG